MNKFLKKALTYIGLAPINININSQNMEGMRFGQIVFYPDDFQTYITKGFAMNPVVYACVTYISRKVASVPFNVYEIQDTKAYEEYSLLIRDVKASPDPMTIVKAQQLKKKALKPVENKTNLLLQLMEKPNTYQSKREFLETTAGFYSLTGNCFINKGILTTEDTTEKKLIGKPTMLSNLSVQFINIISDGTLFGVEKYQWTLFGGIQDLSKETIIHIRTFNPEFSATGEHLFGVSPIRAGKNVLQASNDAYISESAAYQNQGAYGILYDTEGKLDQTKLSELKRKFIQEYTGPENSRRIVATIGKLGYLQMGMSPVDLNIIKSKEMNKKDICMIFGLDSKLFNDDSNSTYNNIVEAKKNSITNAVAPICFAIADAFNLNLVPWYDKYYGKKFCIEPDIFALAEMQADQKEMTSWLKEAYWLRTDQKIEAMGWEYDPKDEEMLKQYLVPASYLPMQRLFEVPADDAMTIAKMLGSDYFRSNEDNRSPKE